MNARPMKGDEMQKLQMPLALFPSPHTKTFLMRVLLKFPKVTVSIHCSGAKWHFSIPILIKLAFLKGDWH